MSKQGSHNRRIPPSRVTLRESITTREYARELSRFRPVTPARAMEVF